MPLLLSWWSLRLFTFLDRAEEFTFSCFGYAKAPIWALTVCAKWSKNIVSFNGICQWDSQQIPFYSWGYWGIERLRGLPKNTQQASPWESFLPGVGSLRCTVFDFGKWDGRRWKLQGSSLQEAGSFPPLPRGLQRGLWSSEATGWRSFYRWREAP